MENKFFEFHQNNTGGSFIINDEVSHIVVIEAVNADHANETAKYVAGIYFNGCEDGSDCPCCGDRWYEVFDGDGSDTPMVYGQPLAEYNDMWAKYAILWSYDPDGKMTAKKVYFGTKGIE